VRIEAAKSCRVHSIPTGQANTVSGRVFANQISFAQRTAEVRTIDGQAIGRQCSGVFQLVPFVVAELFERLDTYSGMT
jgi:hypothetical protein